MDAGGLPQLLRLSRSDHATVRRDASQTLRHIGHKVRDRDKEREARQGSGATRGSGDGAENAALEGERGPAGGVGDEGGSRHDKGEEGA